MWFRSIVDSANSAAAGPSRRSKKRRPQRRRAADRLRLETLEDRCLLTFSAPVDYPAGQLATSVAAADLANNGIQDLVVANRNAGTVGVLPGKGDGSFGPATAFAAGPYPVSVAVGDLTGNGKLDIVTANVGGSVSVLLGNGDGTFQPATTFDLPGVFPPGYTGTTPLTQELSSIAVGDMNHDGHLDLVVTADFLESPTYQIWSGSVDVLLGNGSGGFSVASTTLFNGQPTTVHLADFGNGNLDVTVPSPSGVSVLLGNGDGTLGAPTTYVADITNSVFTPSDALAVGDVNGDGKLDLVAAGGYGNTAGVSVLLGNGDGTFQAAKNTALPRPYNSYGWPLEPLSIAAGDLNADGKLDVAVTGEYVDALYGGQTTVNVLLGNGDGTFTVAQTIPLSGDGVSSSTTTAADFNGDGFPDLAVPNGLNISVLMNEANWSPPAPPPSSFAVSGFPSSTTAGTPGTFTVTALNADGTVDIAYTGTVSFSSSDGQAALPGVYQFTSGDAGVHTFSATLKTAGTQSITASYGTATGSETQISVTPAGASHFAVSAPAGSTAGSALSVTVTALDPYNNTATGYAGTVHFTSSDGQASLPGDYTFTAGDAGLHTFTSGVTLKTAGSQTVTGTDTVTGSINGSATVGVTAAAASTMIVSGFPSPITAGASGSFSVTLKDAYGNVATGYTGTVHFTGSDAKAVLPANYTFTSADYGKHTFSATLKTAGTQSITATDTVSASLHGSDSGITVKSAAASKFILVAPSSVQPGVPFSLTVEVEDAYGNIVTGYVGTIHFSSSDSRAKLPANYSFKAGDAGIHTFTGLVLRRAGNQTITVTDTHNTSITGKTVVDVL